MDFPYLLFQAAFLPVKYIMEAGFQLRKRRLKLPEGIEKQSFQYHRAEPACWGNLYRPRALDGQVLPLIVDIHGGCWIHGDKDVYDCFNYKLASQGHAVSTLTYRTADKVTLKEQVQDIFAYFHYLADHAHILNLDTDCVYLTGDSAGGQLSLLATVINQSPRLQDVFDVEPVALRFQALCLTHSVCFVDQAASLFSSPWFNDTLANPGLLKLLYGQGYETDSVFAHSASPERFIDENTKLPPTLLVTSRGDRHFARHTFKLAEFFDGQGIDYQLYVEEDQKAIHIFNIIKPFSSMAKKCNEVMLEFFHAQTA